MRGTSSCVVLLLIAWAAPVSWGLAPELVERGEQATALVQSASDPARSIGSAFCINSQGIFITAARLAGQEGSSVRLVLLPGDPKSRAVDAKVVRLDMQSNLAVLQTSPAGQFTSLELADTTHLYDTMEVCAFGYPIRNGFARDLRTLPPISVNIGHITTIQKENEDPTRIGIDTALDNGQVGGPVLDIAGKVIGVVNTVGFGNRGPSGAISADQIKALLDKPLVTLKTASLPYDKRHESQELSVGVVSFLDPAPAYDVELTIRTGDEPPRNLTAKVENGQATFSFVPVPGKEDDSLSVNARFEKGSLNGAVANRTITLGDRKIELRDVRHIEHKAGGDEITLTLADGQRLTGTPSGLGDVPVELGNASVTVDLGSALDATLTTPEFPVRDLGCTVTVKTGDKVVSQFTGSIDFTGAPRSSGIQTLSGVGPLINISNGPLLAPGSAIKTVLLGGPGGNPMQLVSPQGADVVGFTCQTSVWANRPIIQSITPLYDRSDAQRPSTVLARDGYVVGGILVDSDLYVHAVKVIFMRLDDGRIDPKDNYVSDWLGTPSSGTLPKQLGGHGEHVIGICGRKGLNMDAIGLILRP